MATAAPAERAPASTSRRTGERYRFRQSRVSSISAASAGSAALAAAANTCLPTALRAAPSVGLAELDPVRRAHGFGGIGHQAGSTRSANTISRSAAENLGLHVVRTSVGSRVPSRT